MERAFEKLEKDPDRPLATTNTYYSVYAATI
jgi:hypothetical protein